MTSYWSREQINVLIQLYRDHHCLYDIKNKDYKNKRERNIALKEIQEEIVSLRAGTTVEEIKAKLHGLRTTFMAEHKKVLASQNGAPDEVYHPTIWYYPAMLFVIKYANPRITLKGVQSLITDATSRSSETQSLADEFHSGRPPMITEDSFDTYESPPKVENESYYHQTHQADVKDFQDHPVFAGFKRKTDEQLSSSKDSVSGKNFKSSPAGEPKRLTLSVSRNLPQPVQSQVSSSNINTTDAFVTFVASKLATLEEDEDILQEAEERITQVLFELQRRLRNKRATVTSE